MNKGQEMNRYNLANDYGEQNGECFSLMEDKPSANGEWVKFSDYEAKIKVKDGLLEAYRLKLNHLEYENELNNSYSNMSNLMLKKKAEINL